MQPRARRLTFNPLVPRRTYSIVRARSYCELIGADDLEALVDELSLRRPPRVRGRGCRVCTIKGWTESRWSAQACRSDRGDAGLACSAACRESVGEHGRAPDACVADLRERERLTRSLPCVDPELWARSGAGLVTEVDTRARHEVTAHDDGSAICDRVLAAFHEAQHPRAPEPGRRLDGRRVLAERQTLAGENDRRQA